MRFVLLASTLALASACTSFDAEFEAYCQARQELSLGDGCSETVKCCAPYQCEAGRCVAPGGSDGGKDSGVDAGLDAGHDGEPPFDAWVDAGIAPASQEQTVN
jgi:hypothetical protein